MQDIVEKFSTHLKNVLTRALCFVVENNQSAILPEHILWALGTEKGCLGSELLHKVRVPVEGLRLLVTEANTTNQRRKPLEVGSPHLSDLAKRAVEKAILASNIYEHRYVGTEHLLSGILQIQDATIEAFFVKEKIDVKELKSHIALVLKSTSRLPDLTDAVNPPEAEPGSRSSETQTVETPSEAEEAKRTPALDYFGRDLTTPDIQQTIDPVIGREAEIERVMEILCRRTKNNPLLLGEPGVGKTAIVEGLAKRILEGRVPPVLQNRRIVALDLALLIAGTMYRGEFEGRLRQVVEEVRKHPNLILFIDEIHTIVGAGAASGSLDAANILKPALARGEIRCIGATTQGEFKKHMETDSALERRFQSVVVDEPTPEKTEEILHGVKSQYEQYHGVTITNEALEAAVRLSVRYVPDKRLPDKALDLVDEAAAAVRVRSVAPGPAEQRQAAEMRLAEIREAKRQAVVEERFEDALALKQNEAEEHARVRRLVDANRPPVGGVIAEREIAEVVSRMTKIPLADILAENARSLDRLESNLSQKIFGQDEAVRLVAAAVRRAKVGLRHPKKPLASFLFLGPSGVGKTELAKVLAEEVFHDPKALIRLDMSEYAEAFTASKLIGAPAGYVGYRDQTKLSDLVKQRSSSLVLFDELEKAHTDVQNLLLQLLEEGELTDATGRRIHFRNTIVVITSNIGLERFRSGGIGFTSGEAGRTLALNEDIRRELLERFRPELVNRIDHTVIFQPLTPQALTTITDAHLQATAAQLSDRKVRLDVHPDVADAIAAQADKQAGARDIRRLVQTLVEDSIAELLSRPSPPKACVAEVKRKRVVVRPLSS